MNIDTAILPHPCLLEFLHSRGAKGEIFSFREVCEVLRIYIMNKVLYDEENFGLVRCDETLRKVLGVKEFTLQEVIKIIFSKSTLSKHTSVISSNVEKKGDLSNQFVSITEREQKPLDLLPNSTLNVRKRKCSDSQSENGFQSKRGHSLIFDLSVESNDSSSEVLSVQGYETAVVQDSSDDVWVSDADKTLSIDTFSVEYEVESDNGTQCSDDSDSDFWNDSIFRATATTLFYVEEDEGFWADSEMSDLEMSDEDKWKCCSCNTLNSPLRSKCDKCWSSRHNWLPEKTKEKYVRSLSAPGILERAGEPVIESVLFGNSFAARSSHIDNILDEVNNSLISESFKKSIYTELSVFHILNKDSNLASSQENANKICDARVLNKNNTRIVDNLNCSILNSGNDVCESKPSPSGSSSNSQNPLYNLDKCIICYSRPKVASLLHGITAHQVCCFPCGRKLKKKKQSCPLCRRPIQKVITNIL